MVHVKTPVKMRKIQSGKAKKPPDSVAGETEKKPKVKKKATRKTCSKVISDEQIKLSIAKDYVTIAPKCENKDIQMTLNTPAEIDSDVTAADSTVDNKDPYAFEFNDEESFTVLPHISQKRTLKQLPLNFEGSLSQNNLSTIAAAAEYTERMHEVFGDTATDYINIHLNGTFLVCDDKTQAFTNSEQRVCNPADQTILSDVTDEIVTDETVTNTSYESSFDSLSIDNQGNPKTNEALLQCPKCGRTLKTDRTFAKHLLICTGQPPKERSGSSKKSKQPFYCDQCDFKSSRKQIVARHMETDHGLYKCLKVRCMYVGESKEILDMHLLQMHKASLPEAGIRYCKKCGQHLQTDEASFEGHVSECKGKEPFICKQCNKEFAYKFAYTNHMNSHFPEQKKKFECTHCDYSSNFKANLQKHIHCIHEQRSRDVSCPKCGKTFFTDESMKRHLKLHSDIRPFQCTICEKTFKTRMSLREHEQIHIEGRPYVCSYNGCTKDFRSLKFLKRHQLEFHNIVPPRFQCPHEGCELSFFRQCQLAKHARTHQDIATLECTYPDCGKMFRHADNLKVHQLQHTNEKPLKCELCQYSCRQRTALNYHLSKCHSLGIVSTDDAGRETQYDLEHLGIQGVSSENNSNLYTAAKEDSEVDEADAFADLMLFDETMLEKSGIKVTSLGAEKSKSQCDKVASKAKDIQDECQGSVIGGLDEKVTKKKPAKKKSNKKKKSDVSEIGVNEVGMDAKDNGKKRKSAEDGETTENETYDDFPVESTKFHAKKKKKGKLIEKSLDLQGKSKKKRKNTKLSNVDVKSKKACKRISDQIESKSKKEVEESSKGKKAKLKKGTKSKKVPAKSPKKQKVNEIEESGFEESVTESDENIKGPIVSPIEDVHNVNESDKNVEDLVESGLDSGDVSANNCDVEEMREEHRQNDENNVKPEVVLQSDKESDLESVDDVPDTPPRAPRMPDVIESDDEFSEPEKEWEDESRKQDECGSDPNVASVEPLYQNGAVDNITADTSVLSQEGSYKTDDSAGHTIHATSLNDSGCDLPRSSLNKDYLDECLEDIASMEQNASSQQAVMSNHSEHNESLENSLAPQSIETNSDINSVHNPMSVARSDVGENIQHVYDEPKQEQPYDLKIDSANAIVHSAMDRNSILNMPLSHQRPVSIPPAEVFPYQQRMELHQPVEVLQPKESSLQRLTNITYQNFGSIDMNAAMSRDMTYLRPADSMFVRPSVASSFMHISDKDSSIVRPGMPTYAGTFARAPNATLLRNSTVADDLFSHDPMACGITRGPFHPSHWPAQEIRPAHWNQNPYLPSRQSINSSASLLAKDKYFIDRDYPLEPAIRTLTDQNMFTSTQARDLSHDSFPLDRFDFTSYFGSHPYSAATATGLDYSRSTCPPNSKQFDERLRQTPSVLPQATSDVFCGINMNPSFNFYKDMYARDTMLRSQHIAAAPDTSIFSHNNAVSQPTYLDPRRSFYPQTNPYAFMDERQYSAAASKLSHPTTMGITSEHDAYIGRRAANSDPQIDDPYRRPIIYNSMNRFF